MNELLSLGLKNLVYYKDATFDFHKGITCVLGENRNARTVGASNGSGKSSLFIPLHSALAYSAPLIKGRLGAKDIFGRGSEASLKFKRGKRVIDVARKGAKFTVFSDGKDLGLRTQSLAIDKISQLRGLTETQFYATVYLDSSKPHAFQSGTSTERLNFFTELFDLQDVDSIRSYCNTLLKDAESANRELQRLRAELKEIVLTDVTGIEQEYQQLVRKQDRTQTLLRTYVAIQHQLDMWERHKKQQKKQKDLEDRTAGWTLKRVREDIAAHRERAADVAATKEWQKQCKTLVQEIRELQTELGNISLSGATDSLEKMSKMSDIEAPVKPRGSRDAASLKKLKDLLGTEPQAKHVQKLATKEAQLLGRASEIRSVLSELKEHAHDDASECPLCRSHLKSDHFQRLIASLTEDLDKAKKQADSASRLKEALETELEFRAYEAAHTKYEKATAGYSQKRHAQLRKYVRAMQSLKQVKRSPPKAPTEAPDTDLATLETLLSDLTSLKTLLEQPGMPEETESNLKSFAITNGGLPFDVALLRTYVSDHTEKAQAVLRKINERIPKLRSQIDLAKADATRARKLRRELQEHKSAATDVDVLKLLVDAYSKTGIKSLLISRLAKSIETNLNRLAPQILREPMKFELQVQGANFHCIAHRRNLGRAIASDVRTLSGAERRMFILLFLMAALPLLPASRRYDTLVLDEPYANLDEPNQEMLRTRLLPKMLKVVPKLVVMVTSPSQVPQGARVVTAVKHNNVTSLQWSSTGPLLKKAA